MKKVFNQHYIILALIIILGGVLRFSYLDFKPFGIDEVITTIFSLGLNYDVIPKNTPISLTELAQIFTLNPHQSCETIAQNLINQSTHPPLFFCALHQWLNLINNLPFSLLTKIRSLPALWGVLSIPLIYILNRIAFSKKAGLMGALVIAISPFHLYLSQEARHYTLPILLIIISLIFFLKITQNIYEKKRNIFLWIIWSLINSLSLYVHYLYIIALASQYLTLLIILTKNKFRQLWLALLSILCTLILFYPWLSIILNHVVNDNHKTNWLSSPKGLAPIFQTIITWILMIIALPIEEQSLIIKIIMGIITLIFTGFFLVYLIPKFKQLWHNYPNTFIFILFIICVLLQFIFIVYILKKDITIAPRYHFIYYPAIASLIGASLSINKNKVKTNYKYYLINVNFLKQNITSIILFVISLISCYFVLVNLALNKPYRPQFVTEQFNQGSDHLMIVMGYTNLTQIALGVGYGLTLEKIRQEPEETKLTLFATLEGNDIIWDKLSQFTTTEDQLWIIAPGLLEKDFPDTIMRIKGSKCHRNKQQFYRIGFPFQGYSCSRFNQ